jgi:molybdopterin molybdotransferase
MTELFTVRTPPDARSLFEAHFQPVVKTERILTEEALDRVLAEQLNSRQDLPNFRRSTVDGYAVNAGDTYGASPGLPAFLIIAGEVPMGQVSHVNLAVGEAALVHTGGMIPDDANAVVMIENTQLVDGHNAERSGAGGSIEVMKAVSQGENVIQIGEDIRDGDPVLEPGRQIRPQDIGGLLALGITEVEVASPPCVAIISTGDEVIAPDQPLQPGQVRDINSYSLAALTTRAGGRPIRTGIVPDDRAALEAAARQAQQEADIVVLSAGSSVSYRDMSVDVIAALGQPGVLVHGVSVRPGKPTIIAVCNGTPVFGLPGNPVSAMVIFDLFVTPTIRALLGTTQPPQQQVQARLARNVASVTGREDYVQVRIEERDGELWAVPVFGKSNLIYTLVHAEGMVKVSLDSNGIREGDWVTVLMH